MDLQMFIGVLVVSNLITIASKTNANESVEVKALYEGQQPKNITNVPLSSMKRDGSREEGNPYGPTGQRAVRDQSSQYELLQEKGISLPKVIFDKRNSPSRSTRKKDTLPGPAWKRNGLPGQPGPECKRDSLPRTGLPAAAGKTDGRQGPTGDRNGLPGPAGKRDDLSGYAGERNDRAGLTGKRDGPPGSTLQINGLPGPARKRENGKRK